MVWQEWLGVTGSMASIAGLVVSGFVLIGVRKLRQRFARQGMIERCLAILERSRDKLNTGIQSRDAVAVRASLAQIRAAVARLRVHLLGEPDVE